MTLNRDAILAAEDLRTETVQVPEWGGEVKVRSLMGFERDQFEASLFEDGQKTASNVRAKLICACTVDDQGDRLFAPADLEALGKKSAAALDRVFTVAQRLNRLARRDVEDLAKN